MGEELNNATQPPGEPAPPSSTLRKILFNERELRAGWRLLVYILLVFLFFLALRYGAIWFLRHLLTWFHLPPHLKSGATSMLIGETLAVIAMFGAAVLLGKFERRTFGTYGLPVREAFHGRFWQGVLWGLVMVSAIILLIRAGGGFSFGQIALGHAAILKYAVLWAMACVMIGFSEEFLFRGYTQFTLASGIGFWPAAILLSAVFGALHLLNGGERLVGGLTAFVVAMFFCLTLRRTGNLWFAVGLHAAFDWSETFLYSVPNSGMVQPSHLFASSLHGPSWLTGGTVGPEGSVMAFAVVGVAFVVFAYFYPRPPEPIRTPSNNPPLSS